MISKTKVNLGITQATLLMGASRICKSPTYWKSGAIQTKSACADSIQPAEAGFVCVAAISNRHVFLQNWDAPLLIPLFNKMYRVALIQLGRSQNFRYPLPR